MDLEYSSRPNAPVVIAVIPARGGSKGLPGKNLRRVGGMSLLARSICACKAAQLVNKVVVSSDDEKILKEGERFGAIPLKRPIKLAGDEASSESALLHALDALDRSPDVLLMIQCTSPFARASDIDACVTSVLNGADSSFTAKPFHSFVWRQGSGTALGVNHDYTTRLRRQDRRQEYVETGAVYAMRTEGFRVHKSRFFGTVNVTPVKDPVKIEIDEWGDLEAARLLAPLFDRDNGPKNPIQAVVFDFDGVFTNDAVYVDQDGREAVRCSRADGLGIERLKRHGIRPLVLSREKNRVVSVRCDKLGIETIQSLDDKGTVLSRWMQQQRIDPQAVAYVGNDVNDLECFELVGMSIAVANASFAVKAAADWCLGTSGGEGAVREVCEWAIRNVEQVK